MSAALVTPVRINAGPYISQDKAQALTQKLSAAGLDDISSMSQEVLNDRVWTFISQLGATESGPTIRLLMRRAIDTANPKIALALADPRLNTSHNFRETLSEAYVPATLNHFSKFLKAALATGNSMLVRECVLSLLPHAKEASGNQRFTSIQSFYTKQVEPFGPFEGLDSFLIDELISPSACPTLSDFDGWVTIYFLMHVSFKKDIPSMRDRFIEKLQSTGNQSKMESIQRLIRCICRLNEKILISQFLTPVSKTGVVFVSPHFKRTIIKDLVKAWDTGPDIAFLQNWTTIVESFSADERKSYIYECLQEYLNTLEHDEVSTLNTLLKMSSLMNFHRFAALCMSKIEACSLHKHIAEKFSFIHNQPITEEEYEGLNNPNITICIPLGENDIKYHCHVTPLTLEAPGLIQILQESSQGKPITKVKFVNISPDAVADIFKIVYGIPWEGERKARLSFNPEWTPDKMIAVYRQAVVWNVESAKRACFQFVKARFYLEDLEKIYALFKPLRPEEVDAKLQEYKVNLAPAYKTSNSL